MTGAKCSPLCGADRAYGPRVRYWHHELQCPRRQEMYEERLALVNRHSSTDDSDRGGGGGSVTDIDQKRDGALSAPPLSDGPTDQPSDPIGAV